MAGIESHHHNNFGAGDQFLAAGLQNNNSGSGTQYNAHNINFNAVQDSDANLFADLRITDPRDDKDRIERTKGGLLRNSYCWILENSDFQAWLNDPEKRLLWVRGDPGKGKTMLLCGLINELAYEGVEPVYFFCQATDARLNTATAVLRGLIYLLLEKRPYLIHFVRAKYKHGGKRFFEDTNSWIALGKVLLEMLGQEDESTRKVVLVIDALDECTNLDDLVDFVVQISSTPTRVIVSSRNWPNVQEGMEAAEQQRQICLELNEDSVSAAVLAYTNYKVNQLAKQKGYDETLRDEVQSYLLSKSAGTFLWVSLVTQRLEDRRLPRRRTLTRLREFPQGLDALYGRMLDQALESEDADIRKRVLAVVLGTFRPLALEELATLIGPPMEDESLEEVIGECGSLLVLRDRIVYFVHHSAKDFLVKHCLDEIMPLGIYHQHTMLFSNSLRTMSQILRQNIHSMTCHGRLSEIPDPDPLAPIEYSCVHWAQHLSEGLPITAREVDQVLAFLSEHYLHWLEAMSLIQMVDKGIACIIGLKNLTQNSAELSRLAPLVYDALRFVKHFFTGIEGIPLQVYSSVVFAPTRSIIKTIYQHEAPDWWCMHMAPPPADEWSKCLQTIELNQLREGSNAFFSSDGKVLAFEDGDVIQVRDANTGGWLNELYAGDYGYPYFATFGGYMLATASSSDILLFNMLIGEEMGERIETGRSDLTSVAFAPDGATLATGSGSGALLLWDIKTRECEQTLQGNDPRGYVRSIVFSSNGLYLAAVVNSVIMVWELNTRWQRRKTFGHDRDVLLVAFASNNRQVQSVSSDGSVKLWDMANSSCLRTIRIPLWDSVEVAFSSDLTKIAVTQSYGPLQLWDVKTGRLLGTLEQDDQVDSLAFSPDDTMLVSASGPGGIIKLWDLKNDIGPNFTPLRQNQSVLSMAFSFDGTQLAVVSYSGLHIWDATTGQCLRMLDRWKASRSNSCWFWGVASVTFGKDGILLAMLSRGSSDVAEIWNMSTETRLQSLADERIFAITGLEFSPDNATIAIAAANTVSLWDIAKGSCIVVYESRTPYRKNEVKFSETGSHLYYDNWKDGEDAIRWEG